MVLHPIDRAADVLRFLPRVHGGRARRLDRVRGADDQPGRAPCGRHRGLLVRRCRGGGADAAAAAAVRAAGARRVRADALLARDPAHGRGGGSGAPPRVPIGRDERPHGRGDRGADRACADDDLADVGRAHRAPARDAAARVPADATAFALRGVPYVVLVSPQCMPGWAAAAARGVADRSGRRSSRTRPAASTSTTWATRASSGVRAAYGANHARLAALKRRYDPTTCSASTRT